jgi:hypothetical protein
MIRSSWPALHKASCALRRGFSVVEVEQSPLEAFFPLTTGDMNGLHGPGVKASMIHYGREDPRGEIKVLDLVGDKAGPLEIKDQLSRVIQC